jgi:Holliday junction resolvase-like predicted endonuclease
MSTRRTTVGATGELVAAHFLERRGAAIVDRNVRVGRDEVDLVIRLSTEDIAVEVKTGIGADSRPWENFDEAKCARTRRAACILGIRRIDLIAVELTPDGAAIRWLPDVG